MAKIIEIDETFKERKHKEYLLTLIPFYPKAIAQSELITLMQVSKQSLGQYIKNLEGAGKVRVFKKGKKNFVTREAFVK